MDGSVITRYNVSAAKQNQVRNVLSPRPDRSRWNNSLDLGFNARLPRGARLFGGLLVHRTLEVFCDISDNPNLLLHCDQSESDIPWLLYFPVHRGTGRRGLVMSTAVVSSVPIEVG